MTITHPIPGFSSVVGFAVYGLPGDGVQAIPGLPFGLVQFALLFLRELLVRDEFFHTDSSSFGFRKQYITTAQKCINDL